MAAPATTCMLSTLLQLPLAPFSGKSSPPSVVRVARRAPTAVVAAAKGYNVQILVDENEGEESIFRRFRREVMRAGVLQEIKRRRRYENKTDEKKRKAREAGRRNRRRRMMDEPRFPEEDAGAAGGARDEDDDNWEIDAQNYLSFGSVHFRFNCTRRPAPRASVFGCNPITDKTCKPKVPTVLPGGGVDIDGDGDEDELPGFDPHLTILGHAH
ncbi:hypothetical protein HU200_000359 [Digitaria exilis]|uniref:Uncharacterized protein n=1 Tax=Digitaria exilis TaxID=1010633 RepID=A0A835G148_9POAL|nr:hypothetical protein HU200_000359 [Digitaria exilis]